MNKIIKERIEKNKEEAYYQMQKDRKNPQNKKMKQFLFMVNTEETHKFVYKLIIEFGKFVEEYNKKKYSKVKKTKKCKKKLSKETSV